VTKGLRVGAARRQSKLTSSPVRTAPKRSESHPLLRRDLDSRWASLALGELLHDPDTHVAESGGAGSMAGVSHLLRLALAAVRRAPDHPAIPVDDGIAGAPELRRDTCVRRVFHQVAELAVLDFPGEFGAELEVQPLVVD